MKGFIGVALIGVRLLVLLVSFYRGSLTVISPKILQEIKAVKAQIEGEAELNSSGTTDEGRVRDVIMAWCAAYSQMNSKAMVSIETTNAEIVDGFGELHRSLSRSSRESFWDEGFEMIQPEQFHPECVLEHIQFLDPEAAVVQVRTAYLLGIELKGGEVIPPYAEVHTFIATRSEGQWLIAAHIFVREQMTRTSGAVSW